MVKKIGIKKINTTIPSDVFISKVNSIMEDIKNITFNGVIKNKEVLEYKDYMCVLLDFEDNTGSIKALIIGNRDKEFKNLINSINTNSNYKIHGNVVLINDVDSNEFPFIDKIKDNKILIATALEESDSFFGISIVSAYDLELKEAYKLINDNTNYLINIPFDDVKEIEISYYKDIFILLNDGTLLINNKKKIDNIRTLGFLSGVNIFAFTYDNVVMLLILSLPTTKFINNNNYKYKKLMLNYMNIIGLTYENDIKIFGSIIDGVIDNKLYCDIQDIGYNADNDDIVVIKDGNVYSLFNNIDYSNMKPEIMVSGKNDEFGVYILESEDN